MTTWTHPEEIMRLKILGEKPHCKKCRHLKQGKTANDWCAVRKNDPTPNVAFDDDEQFCTDFQGKPP